ncbi:MAG: winged helix-turn-helix domain-containing protein [Alphaproteobacteria bacterium]
MDATLTFGPFRLVPAQNLLLDGERPVRLGARALEMLALLVERAGDVVPHEEIRSRVWPGTFVDDTNLRVQMAALRKALGDGQGAARYIVNSPGRGYRFVAPVARTLSTDETPRAIAAPPTTDNLPVLLTRLVGRDEHIRAVAEQLPRRRLITLAGPGGVGKTTVAVAAAGELRRHFAGAVHFVDLAPLSEPALVPGAVAATLGLSVPTDAPLPAIVALLRDRTALLVLDNCEHLLDPAAALAEAILAGASGVCMIATSREPLRAQGEWVRRLPTLALPGPGDDLTAEAALASPAVQLFVERVVAGIDSFELTDADAPIAVEICRHLDGIPLAIELAAARVGQFGIRGLARLLGDRFAVLRGGRRTAAPRQQTLRGALDWSFGTLSADEQSLLARLSVFPASFAIESAVAVAGGGEDDVVEGVARLAAKSLLSADVSRDVPLFRLLESTRAYAGEKLRERGEAGDARRRHAHHVGDLLRVAEAEWGVRPATEWRDTHCRLVDDVRAALAWSFAPDGDPALGLALTTASGPLWFQSSLIHEYRGRLQAALRQAAAPAIADDAVEMRLQIALSAAVFNTTGPGTDMAAASRRAFEIAARIGDTNVQLQALWGMSGERYQSGDYRAAHDLAVRFGEVAAAAGDAAAGVVHDRMMALALHVIGEHARARVHAERAVAHPPGAVRTAQKSMYEYDNRVAARCHLARILWISGATDRARAVAAEGLAFAKSLGYPPTICYVLVFAACPVAIWESDIDGAGELVRLLRNQADDPSFAHWRSWAGCYEAALALHDGTAIASDGDAPAWAGPVIGAVHTDLMGTLHDGLAGERAIGRACEGSAPWSAPAVLRAHGERLVRNGDRAGGETMLRRALELARTQGALSWELRAALALVRAGGAPDSLLPPVVDRFPEPSSGHDFRRALALLGRV